MSSQRKIHLAYFITPHGYGHAARASAIMTSMTEINPNFHFEIFTQVPEWFFSSSQPGSYTYHDCFCDVGLAQKTPLTEDLHLTIERLGKLLPFIPDKINDLVRKIQSLNCKMILCDIAPLGIAVANAAGIPSVLIENFTWDWIYQGYVDEEPMFQRPIHYLHEVFLGADYHIQTEPVCVPSIDSHLTTRPISRKARIPGSEIRVRLGIPSSAKVVLISMGGIQGEYHFAQKLAELPDVYFVVPGAGPIMKVDGNRIFLPHHSDFYHPDLMFASDMVIGKAGYSTIAEAYWASIPFAYVARQRFPESAVMTEYIQKSIGGFEISAEVFQGGNWISRLPEWISKPRIQREPLNGADQAARFHN